jgi:hexosaminidase
MVKPITVIPKPVSASYGNGSLAISGRPRITGAAAFQDEISAASEQYWGDLPGGGEGRIICEKEDVFADSVKAAEGYRLRINRDGVFIGAASGAGCYHGLQTLRQLFLSENQNGLVSLPYIEIEDYPRFSWRGYMLDSARHFFPVPVVKKLLDAISLHHINRFHWHLTDTQGWRFPVEKYPLLAEVGRKVDKKSHNRYTEGLYTAEELKDVVAYAAARHIEIMPEVEFPGHAYAALAAYPDLLCPDAMDRNVFCAGNDRLFDLAAAVFDSLGEIFPSPFVHFGGDEVSYANWEHCPRCKQRLAETGLQTHRELQSWITVKLARLLEERGKTAVGWDEILEDTERYKLPQSVVVMSWRGAEGVIKASSLGHRVIMSPTNAGCYFCYKPWDSPEEMGGLGNAFEMRGLGHTPVIHTYEMDPVTPGMNAEASALILGGQGDLWTEAGWVGRIAEYLTFPRICALSETLWIPGEQKDFADFKTRLLTHRKRLDDLDILSYRGPLGD